MILQKYLVKDFNDESTVNTIEVPANSIFLKMVILTEGIYALYAANEQPTLHIVNQDGDVPIPPKTELHSYLLVRLGNVIPEGAEFVDILSLVVEQDGGQGVIIFSIFKISLK